MHWRCEHSAFLARAASPHLRFVFHVPLPRTCRRGVRLAPATQQQSQPQQQQQESGTQTSIANTSVGAGQAPATATTPTGVAAQADRSAFVPTSPANQQQQPRQDVRSGAVGSSRGPAAAATSADGRPSTANATPAPAPTVQRARTALRLTATEPCYRQGHLDGFIEVAKEVSTKL